MDKFSYEANGYNRSEVNKFIDDVIEQTEAIINRCRYQDKKIEQLNNELKHYKDLEKTLNRAIIKAEEVGDDIKRLASEEASLIVNDAKGNASRIVNEALLKADKIENKAQLLEKNVKIFKKKLKIIVEQQMAVVEEIEVLELDR